MSDSTILFIMAEYDKPCSLEAPPIRDIQVYPFGSQHHGGGSVHRMVVGVGWGRRGGRRVEEEGEEEE